MYPYLSIGLIAFLLTACGLSSEKKAEAEVQRLDVEIQKLHIRSMDKDKTVQSYIDSFEKVKEEKDLSSLNIQKRGEDLHLEMNEWMREFHWIDSSTSRKDRAEYLETQRKIVADMDDRMEEYISEAADSIKKFKK